MSNREEIKPVVFTILGQVMRGYVLEASVSQSVSRKSKFLQKLLKGFGSLCRHFCA